MKFYHTTKGFIFACFLLFTFQCVGHSTEETPPGHIKIDVYDPSLLMDVTYCIPVPEGIASNLSSPRSPAMRTSKIIQSRIHSRIANQAATYGWRP